MSLSEDLLLSRAAIIIIVACILYACICIVFLRWGAADEPPDFSGEPKLLRETSDELLLSNRENLSAERKRELLEKIKKERINEYLDKKKRKFT